MVFPLDSSHFKHWLFSETTLKHQRGTVLRNAAEKVTKQLENKGVSVNESLWLNEQECDFLVSYFVSQLLYVCSEKRFDYKVTNTAAAFLTRFYLKRSVLEHDPRRILLSCILLAIKSEDLAMSTTLHHFCEGLISPKGIRLADVIDSELVVLDALSFHLLVLQPRTPIHYLTTEYYRLYKPARAPETASPEDKQAANEACTAFGKLISEINREAEQLALQAFTNQDIPFLFSPSQLGIACFLHVSEGRLSEAERFVSSLLNASEKGSLFDAVRPKLLDLRTRLVFMTEEMQQGNDEEKAQRALRSIKKLDKLTKLLRGTGKKEKNSKKQKKEEMEDVPMTPPSSTMEEC